MFGKSKNFNSKFQFDLSQFTNNVETSPGITLPNFGTLPPDLNQVNGNAHGGRDKNETSALGGFQVKDAQFKFKPLPLNASQNIDTASFATLHNSSHNSFTPKDTFTAAALNPISSQAAVFKAAKFPKEIRAHHSKDAFITVHDWSKVYPGRLAFYESTANLFENLHGPNNKLHNGTGKRHTNGNLKSYKQDALHAYASEYTSKLIEYQKHLNQDVRKEVDPERKTIRTFVAIWHLCEILYFQKDKEAPIAKAFVEWLNLTDKSGLLKYDTQRIIHHPDPYSHPEFWEFVYKLILRGQTQVVTTLLGHAIKTIPAPSIKIINELISILNSMPELSNHYSASAETKYMKRRSKWLKDVEHFKHTLQGSTQVDQTGLFSHALDTLNLISGDRNTIMKHSSNRNDAIVAILLYSCPSTARRELADVVRLVDKTFPVHGSDTSAEACRAFMLGEIYEGIVVCASEDWWLVAHLTDLMEMVDLLETRSNLGLMVDENDVELREYFILNYAQSLFSHGSLWEHALFYLSTCPTQGLSWMHELVLRVPTTDDVTVSRLLDTCLRFHLDDQYKTICRIAAKGSVRMKNFTQAVKYYQKANDAASVVGISDQILDAYLVCGELITAKELMEIKGNSDSMGGSFDFLLLYAQLHDLLAEGDHAAAGQHLLRLFNLPSSRTDFWPILFIDALPLFQDHASFNQDDTFQLLHYLEQLTVFSRGNSAYFKNIQRYMQNTRIDSHSDTEHDLADMIDTFYETVRFGLTRMLAHEFLA